MLYQTGVHIVSVSKNTKCPNCAFVWVQTEAEKQILLSWNKILLADVNGFWILHASLIESEDWNRQRRIAHLPFGAITIEEPRPLKETQPQPELVLPVLSLVVVQFSGHTRQFKSNMHCEPGSIVVVEGDRGEDMGEVLSS